jgi:beta propeller repeat protein
MYNIKTSKQLQITNDLSSQMNPRVWGNYIIWQDSRNDPVKDYPGRWSLYLYDINSEKEKLICNTLAAHSTINISDNKIVWEDERNFKGEDGIRGGDNVPENNKDIYMYDILTEVETPVATESLMECRPDISSNYIVFEDRNNGSLNADIVLYNISTKEKTFITKDKYDQGTPRIYGHYVVWMDERRGTSTNDVIINGQMPNSDIFLYDITTKKEKLLTGDEPQIMPGISKKWIAYVNSRQNGGTVDVVEYK